MVKNTEKNLLHMLLINKIFSLPDYSSVSCFLPIHHPALLTHDLWNHNYSSDSPHNCMLSAIALYKLCLCVNYTSPKFLSHAFRQASLDSLFLWFECLYDTMFSSITRFFSFFLLQTYPDYSFISLFILFEISRARKIMGWMIEQYNEEKGKNKKQTRFGWAEF